jgi:hypothetical protein
MRSYFYWTSTFLVSAFMIFVALAYLSHQPKMLAEFSSLGYPRYFPNLLGVFKILGVIALLVPKFPRLKEWAYAGFAFTFIGAFVSHLAMGQNHQAIMPVFASVLLAASYFTRPLSRRLPAVVVVFAASETEVVETEEHETALV